MKHLFPTTLIVAALLFGTGHHLEAQSLAEKTAQAEAVAAQNAAPADDAKTIAQTLAEAFGQLSDTAALIDAAQALAAANPSEAAAIAAAAAVFSPNAAPQIAAALATAMPSMAPQIAAAVAQVAPSMAPQIAAAVAQAVPAAANAIAQSVAQVAPEQSAAIANAITSAVPTADAGAIQAAAETGAQEAASMANGSSNPGGVPLPSGSSGGGGGNNTTSNSTPPTPPAPPQPAFGTPFYWDGGANGWSLTGPGAGGNGTWSATAPWNANYTANFGGTPGTVTLLDAIRAAGLTFASGGYTLTGGSVTFSGSTALITLSSGTTTFNTSLSGGTINLVGGGTFSLGANGNVTSSSLNVSSDTTLAGGGTITGNTTVSGTHDPGFSPGIQTFNGNLTYNSGATIKWDLIENSSTQNSTSAIFDQIIVNGLLSFNVNQPSDINIQLNFNSADSIVLWANGFWNSNQTWDIFLLDRPTNPFADINLGGEWTDSNGVNLAALRPGAEFILAYDGTVGAEKIVLNYIYSVQ